MNGVSPSLTTATACIIGSCKSPCSSAAPLPSTRGKGSADRAWGFHAERSAERGALTCLVGSDGVVIEGWVLAGGRRFGPPLELRVRVPDRSSSTVTVSFSELPVDTWHSLSNKAKRQHAIAKGAGVSIVRAGREIDHGWYFMADKRAENYDDWWGCQIAC